MRGRLLAALAAVAMGTAAACSSATGSNKVSGSGGTAATGGAGTGGGGGITTDGGGSGGLGPGCASDTYDGQLVPLDMYVMQDRSGSMSDTFGSTATTKWDSITGAFSQFVSLPGLSGLAMGLGFFPVAPSTPPPTTCATISDCGNYGPCNNGKCATTCPLGICAIGGTDSCDYPDYSTPAVAIAPLPGVGAQITMALAGTSPNGGTPMDAALHGAITYAQKWSQQHTDHITIVVLATDGDPSGCDPDTFATVAARAAQGLASKPSIETFVIGVGSSLTSLNQIAQSGGTGQAIIVNTSADPGQQFLDALNKIRGAVGCTYKIPTSSSGQQPDYKRVNVAFTPSGGKQSVLPNVGGSGNCQGGPGWYYDDPNNPTQIILCPSSCDLVTHQTGKVDVVVGCLTIVK